MPVSTREQAIARAKALGGEESASWEGASRSSDLSDLLLKGDILHFPEKYDKIYKNPRLNNAQFCIIDVTRGGQQLSVHFYPGSLTKSIPLVEADKSVLGYHPVMKVDENGKATSEQAVARTKGTAVDYFQSVQGELNAQMDLLKGKDVQITDVSPRFKRYNAYQNRISDSTVMQFDLIDDKGKIVDGAGKTVPAGSKPAVWF